MVCDPSAAALFTCVRVGLSHHAVPCCGVLCCEQVQQLQQQLQAAADQAAAGAHKLAAMLPSDKHQQLLKSAKAAAAAEAQQQAQAEHVAEVRVLPRFLAQVMGCLSNLAANSGVGWCCCCMFFSNKRATGCNCTPVSHVYACRWLC